MSTRALTTIFALALPATSAFGVQEIYFQPPERICYETYYGDGSQFSPSVYIPIPNYSTTPEVIAPSLECRGESFFHAEYLYWKTNENGLGRYVSTKVSEQVDCSGYSVSIKKEKNNDLSFDWSSGFRVGIGHRFWDTCWEMSAYWSHLFTTANAHLTDEGRVKCDLIFNAVDLLASYKFCMSNSFLLKPYFGLKIAAVNQKLKTNFSSEEREGFNFYDFYNHTKQRFVGIGPLVGLEGILNLKRGISFYASAAISGLYGNYHLNFKDSNRFCDGESSYSLKQHQYSWDAVLDLAIGFRWECGLKNAFPKCTPNVRLAFDIGLEHHHYFRLNRLNSNGNSGKHRDLFFDGVNVGAKLIF